MIRACQKAISERKKEEGMRLCFFPGASVNRLRPGNAYRVR